MNVLRSKSLQFLFVATMITTPVCAAAQTLWYGTQADPAAYVLSEKNGATSCREASYAEAVRLSLPHHQPLKTFGERGIRLQSGLNIILRGTAQLDANPQAKAAFERAAAIWESRIANPVTIYVDVDFGAKRFGQDFSEGTIASASTPSYLFDPGSYAELRPLIVGRADNAAEITILNLLPASAVATDSGSLDRFGAGAPVLRALGAFDAVALSTDDAPSIGFNSAFSYDFDPANGIAASAKDFEGVVVHEIGHMLGFSSRVGSSELSGTTAPSVLDLFRFRPGVNTSSFGTAQRVLSTGGSQVFFMGGPSLALSTGNPSGENGDERQASHWKDDSFGGGRIGIMDPTLASGERTELTQNDLDAFGVIGWNIAGGGGTPGTPAPAAPSNLTASGTSSSAIRLNWQDNSANETEFRIEQKTSAGNFVDLGSAAANATTVNITGFSAGQSATFRVRARNAAGDSPYSNEATGTATSGGSTTCVPSSTVVCLLSNRFRVSVAYVNPFSNPPNQPGTFLTARLLQGVQNPDTALFGFSSAQAVEVVVRIQDTRPFAARFDVYYGGMTDVEYTVTVTDTQTGVTRDYKNNAGTVGGGVDRNSYPASALGPLDRITSGGQDAFYAAASLAAAMDPAVSEAKRVAGSARSLVMGSLGEEPLGTEKSTGLRSLAAGGGGACAEIEPNNTAELADSMTFGQPCTGNADVNDSSQYFVQYSGSQPNGKIHDVFKVTLGSAAKITVNMTFSTASADLDVFLFTVSGSTLTIRGASVGSTTTENFTTADTLSPGTYYVGVGAYSGSSAYSVTATVPATATPSAPSGLTATGTSTSAIRLQWQDNSTNETEFRIEQKTNSGTFVDLGSAAANATAINITGFTAGQSGTFRVRARNASGDSAYSNEATGTTLTNSGGCTPNSTTVCLLSDRFRVSIAYVNPFSNPPNQPGTFLAARLLQGVQNPDTALFGFSSAQAVEVVVRVQDTRPFAPRFDIYYGGMTDVEYTVSVTDTQTGTARSYRNQAGTVGGGVDRTSFPAN